MLDFADESPLEDELADEVLLSDDPLELLSLLDVDAAVDELSDESVFAALLLLA
ncbi:MAG TPA: hypothetical protein VMU41_07540 [Candidatus Binataceae bacterium]|nr:hypothetical protein [Candidatus Binataceae bacterium]